MMLVEGIIPLSGVMLYYSSKDITMSSVYLKFQRHKNPALIIYLLSRMNLKFFMVQRPHPS